MSERIQAGPIGCSTGCLGPAIVVMVVIGGIIMLVTAFGHLFGLTPSVHEFNAHSGDTEWMHLHYPHVYWRLLAAGLILSVLIGLPTFWLASLSSQEELEAQRTRLAAGGSSEPRGFPIQPLSSNVERGSSFYPEEINAHDVPPIARPRPQPGPRAAFLEVAEEVWRDNFGVTTAQFRMRAFQPTTTVIGDRDNGGVQAAIAWIWRLGDKYRYSSYIEEDLIDEARAVLSDPRLLGLSVEQTQ